MAPGTVHLVYPHGLQLSCPDAIGRHLAKRLSERYPVKLYDWDELCVIRPGPGDVLLGHPHPSPWTIFRMSCRLPGWRRRLMMSPFNGDLRQIAFEDATVRRCDKYLAITGNYWFRRVETTGVRHWQPKMVHLDLAVDRAEYPAVKRSFGEPMKRKFLYIGYSRWTKNVGYLQAIAEKSPPGTFAWMGGGDPIPRVTALGLQDFSSEAARELVSKYDFLITVGRNDANPATILEAMAWGLVPVCTAQSGYEGYPGIANLPLDDVDGALEVLRRLNAEDDASLRERQADNWRRLDEWFTWERFTDQVVAEIEGDARPQTAEISFSEKVRLTSARLQSPYSPLRPRNLAREMAHRFRRLTS